MTPTTPPTRLLTIALALILAATAALPIASPTTDSSVHLTVLADAKLLASHEPFAWQNTVSLSALPGGATGLDLLAHVAAQRGSTYDVIWFDDAAWVEEVNGVATDFTLILVGYYWALYADGEYSEHAINQIGLTGGTHLEIRYEGFPVDL